MIFYINGSKVKGIKRCKLVNSKDKPIFGYWKSLGTGEFVVQAIMVFIIIVTIVLNNVQV